MCNEKPIIFSGPMVRAILDGRKTQTRRVVKPQPPESELGGSCYDSLCGPEWYDPVWVDEGGEQRPGKAIFGAYSEDGEWGIKCPYHPGMRLWARESFDWVAGTETVSNGGKARHRRIESVAYKADGDHPPSGKWTPSIHMPRWASRIMLEIKDVRAQCVQDISEEDAIAEGIFQHHGGKFRQSEGIGPYTDNPVLAFRWLWDSINSQRGYGWSVNPWVWAIEFKRVQPPALPGERR